MDEITSEREEGMCFWIDRMQFLQVIGSASSIGWRRSRRLASKSSEANHKKKKSLREIIDDDAIKAFESKNRTKSRRSGSWGIMKGGGAKERKTCGGSKCIKVLEEVIDCN